jgi:peptide/nickel transport system permease protein
VAEVSTTRQQDGEREPVMSAVPVRRGPGARARALFGRLGVAGTAAWGICLAYCVFAVLGPFIVPQSPESMIGTPFQGPSAHYWLGLDQLGRSVLSEVIIASRVAVVAAVIAVAIAATIGTALGLVAGYVSGVVGHLVGWFFDLLFSVPSYLLGILVVVVAGPGLLQASCAIGVAFIPQFGRIARGAAAELRQRGYVESALLAGRSRLWIMTRHVLPNIMTPIAVMIGLSLANTEGAYAVLSYLGFGVRPPTPDYGSMIASGQGYLITDPSLVLFPCFALALLIVGFALLGDWIAERFDPHRRSGSIGWRSHS